MKHNSDKVVNIVAEAGGVIVGMTRLQKIAYLLEVTGLGEGFDFEHRCYGPHSEGFRAATAAAIENGRLTETNHKTGCGGFYSVYTTAAVDLHQQSVRARLIRIAAVAGAVELELVATVEHLARQGYRDPWAEAAMRSPLKALDGRLEVAQVLLAQLCRLPTPIPLPTCEPPVTDGV
jgi:uncharacterized protein YwgA